MPVYKIAIAGASTLLGRELKEAISESPLAASTFALLDEEDAKGQLDQVGDEVTFIQTIGPDAFDQVDFTFLCGTETLTRKHWRQALRSGSTVLDMSGALDQEAGGPVYTGGGSGAPRSGDAGVAA
jgi:aspartate-semialdehyde dehydrogenase